MSARKTAVMSAEFLRERTLFVGPKPLSAINERWDKILRVRVLRGWRRKAMGFVGILFHYRKDWWKE